MKNKTAEPLELAHYINKFLSEYAPSHLTNSDNTLDSYGTALTLYMGYLETQRGITPDKFSRSASTSSISKSGWNGCPGKGSAAPGVYRKTPPLKSGVWRVLWVCEAL